MFDKVLIANRGEIAVRIIAACHELGVKTVAVYSEVDERALHVLSADEAICLGHPDAIASYLNIEKLIAIAKQTQAQAIHPGYGFLAENPVFAERCEQEGIVFIGPPAQVIKQLGNKTVARRIMSDNNIPIIPGMMQEEANPEILMREADSIGYPVLIKAVAGGGGKGVRIVHSPQEIREAAESAAREAQSAFGDGTIYMEKCLLKPRHVEVQILADAQGNVIHLLERECSIQRRRQKIIEESPALALSPEIREEMRKAAIVAARATGYINAGTVEFLVAEDNRFYFLEVNTRLQVEHPVTEMVTGVDIVQQQLSIAAGNPLRLSQQDIVGYGHAIECRIYAEDPLNDFLPSPGEIKFVREPRGPGLRVDSGIYSGCIVPTEYDPILSKIITHASDRKGCISRMIGALKDYAILGVLTPIPFLLDVLSSEAFRNGETNTDFINVHFANWRPAMTEMELACLAYIVDDMKTKRNRQTNLFAAEKQAEHSPWQTLGNFRP